MRSFPYSISPQNDDERFMLEALREAWKAYQEEEVPVGAVLVHEGRVIGRGHNQVEMLRDATAHAEMLCLTAGAGALENWRLSGSTLYCTLEPCCMCAGALLLSRVDRLVWAAPDLRHGAAGSWIDVFSPTHPTHRLVVSSGVLEVYAAQLMKDFFQKRRKENELERDRADNGGNRLFTEDEASRLWSEGGPSLDA